MTLKVIAYARNGHTDKFGIPRQSREESPILTRIVFEPEYSVAEALRGIEGYSHLWLLWGFSEISRPRDFETSKECTKEEECKKECTKDNVQSTKEGGKDGLTWSPTVRPPRLGGNRRMGVFATRSPYRPNPIGLTSVRLIKVQCTRYNVQGTKDGQSTKYNVQGTKEGTKDNGQGTMELIVSGADMLDGTPIYDIKPYLSFSDSHADAENGFAEAHKDERLEVDWSKVQGSLEAAGAEIAEDLTYILSQDPRPGYQEDPLREYKLDYMGYKVTFRVQEERVAEVLKLEAK